jgi:hypothetical protein
MLRDRWKTSCDTLCIQFAYFTSTKVQILTQSPHCTVRCTCRCAPTTGNCARSIHTECVTVCVGGVVEEVSRIFWRVSRPPPHRDWSHTWNHHLHTHVPTTRYTMKGRGVDECVIEGGGDVHEGVNVVSFFSGVSGVGWNHRFFN